MAWPAGQVRAVRLASVWYGDLTSSAAVIHKLAAG
jgi:hypothetical protein